MSAKDALAALRRAMKFILSPVPWQLSLAYFAEIMIFLKWLVDCIRKVWCALGIQHEVWLAHNLKNYKFSSEKSACFDRLSQLGPVELVENSTGALEKPEHLTIQTGRLSFFGLCDIFNDL